MKAAIRIFMFMVVLIGQSSLYAQHPGVWRYYPEIDLPFIIDFTPEGYALVHNHDTIFIYDGYQVKTISTDCRLGSIQQDEQGYLWSVYNDESRIMPPDHFGMIRYDPSTEEWQKFPIPGLREKTTWDTQIFQFYEPNRVIMTDHERFFVHDLEAGQSENLLHKEDTLHDSFVSIHKGSAEGVFWGFGDKGIFQFTYHSDGKWTWREFLLPDTGNMAIQWWPVVLSDQEIYARIVDQSTEPISDYMMQFHGDRYKKISANYSFRTHYGWVDSLRRIWTTGWLDGAIYMQEPGKEIKAIERNDILGLPLCDFAFRKGDIALVGSIGGLMRHAPPLWQPPAKLNPRFHGYEKVLGMDKSGYLWLAKQGQLIRSKGNNVHHYDIETFPQPEDFYNLNFELQVHPLADGREALYFHNEIEMRKTGRNHLVVYNRSKDIIESVSSPNKILFNGFPGPKGTVYFVCQDQQTSLYSLEQFDGRAFSTIADEETIPELDNVTRVFHTRDGDIWLLNFYLGPFGILREGNYQPIEPPEESHPNRPGSAFLELSDGTIWAGFGYSVYEYDKGTWRQILDCSQDVGVFQMLECQDGSIWVVSRKRLYRWKDGIWTYHNYKEGLPSSCYQEIYEDSEQRLWALTRTGDWLFCPEADVDPPIVKIPADENIQEFLPHVNVRITFTAEDRWRYTDEEKLQYSYCLDNGDWSPYSYNAFAAFSKLEPGNHRLEVTAMDVNYNHAIKPAVWEFTVAAPWYKEPGFLVIMTLASFVILALLSLLVSRYFNLTKLVAERTEHLASANKQLLSHREKLQALTSELFLIEERERRKLASDLHDSISQSLSLSMLELSSLTKSKIAEEIQEQASRIRKRLDQTLQSTRNLTYQLCPPLLYQAGLGPALVQLADEFQTHHEFTVAFKETGSSQSLVEEIRYFLFRATRELLVNITKHAQASQVEIALTWEENSIRIQVSDDGVGFAKQETRTHLSDQGGYGLFGLRERAGRMGGKLDIQSIPGQGTIVSLTIPL